jgi:hypothetical protein
VILLRQVLQLRQLHLLPQVRQALLPIPVFHMLLVQQQPHSQISYKQIINPLSVRKFNWLLF